MPPDVTTVIVTVAGDVPRSGTVTEHAVSVPHRVGAGWCPKYAVIWPFVLKNPEPEIVRA